MNRSEGELRSEIRGFVERRMGSRGGASAIGDDESLVDRGVIDSMGIFQLVAFLEERFGIRIADDEISQDNFGTVNAIMRFVADKI